MTVACTRDVSVGMLCIVQVVFTQPHHQDVCSCAVPASQGPKGLQPTTWQDAFAAIQAAVGKVKGNEIKAIAGKLSDAETMIAVKDLLNRLGSGNMKHEDDTGVWAEGAPGAGSCLFVAAHSPDAVGPGVTLVWSSQAGWSTGPQPVPRGLQAGTRCCHKVVQ